MCNKSTLSTLLYRKGNKYGRFIKHFYVKSQNGGRFSGEDDNKCKKKCTFVARSVF